MCAYYFLFNIRLSTGLVLTALDNQLFGVGEIRKLPSLRSAFDRVDELRLSAVQNNLCFRYVILRVLARSGPRAEGSRVYDLHCAVGKRMVQTRAAPSRPLSRNARSSREFTTIVPRVNTTPPLIVRDPLFVQI